MIQPQHGSQAAPYDNQRSHRDFDDDDDDDDRHHSSHGYDQHGQKKHKKENFFGELFG
jgi:Zn-finger nucleic acid-binding protein